MNRNDQKDIVVMRIVEANAYNTILSMRDVIALCNELEPKFVAYSIEKIVRDSTIFARSRSFFRMRRNNDRTYTLMRFESLKDAQSAQM